MGPVRLGEQRLPGSEFITPRDAVVFPIPDQLHESLATVLPLAY